MKERLETISEAMKTSIQFDRDLCHLFARMSKIEATAEVLKELENNLFPAPQDKESSTRRTNMVSKFNKSVESEFLTQGKNLWGLFNGVTRYTNHEMSIRKESDKQSNVMVGQGAKLNHAAFEYMTSKFQKELIRN
jgi:hypothetical protein